MKGQILKLLVLLFLFIIVRTSTTGAYLSDSETLSGATLTAGTWGSEQNQTVTQSVTTESFMETLSPIPEETMTPEPTASPEASLTPEPTESPAPTVTATPADNPTEIPTPTDTPNE